MIYDFGRTISYWPFWTKWIEWKWRRLIYGRTIFFWFPFCFFYLLVNINFKMFARKPMAMRMSCFSFIFCLSVCALFVCKHKILLQLQAKMFNVHNSSIKCAKLKNSLTSFFRFFLFFFHSVCTICFLPLFKDIGWVVSFCVLYRFIDNSNRIQTNNSLRFFSFVSVYERVHVIPIEYVHIPVLNTVHVRLIKQCEKLCMHNASFASYQKIIKM